MTTFQQFLQIASRDPDARSLYQILEDHPEYVNKKDNRGRTAVFYAAEAGHGDVVETLIQFHGADIFVQDKDGRTLADILQENEDTRYLIEEVLQPIADKAGKDLTKPDVQRDEATGAARRRRKSIRRTKKQKRKTRKQKKSRR